VGLTIVDSVVNAEAGDTHQVWQQQKILRI